MPSVDVIYIITTRQFVRPSRGIEGQGVCPSHRYLKHLANR